MLSLRVSLEDPDKPLASYPITKQHTRIGRLPGNDIVLNGRAVSGTHAVLIRNGSSLLIEDLGSRNGIFVGGSSVRRAELKVGHAVRVGEYTLTVFAESAPPAFEPTMMIRATPRRQFYLRRLNGAPDEMFALSKIVTTLGKPGLGVLTFIRRGDDVAVRFTDGPTSARLNDAELTDAPVLLRAGDILSTGAERLQFVVS